MPEVIAAVEGAVAWFEAAKITGIRLEKQGRDRVLVEDSGAPPLWARFYDLKTGQPFFCDRDGVSKSTIAEIGSERRDGYAWCGSWPAKLLETTYPKWRARHR